MKKIIVILAIAMALSAANAFAIGTTDTQATNSIKGFNPTLKINLYYKGNTNGDAWSAVSAHQAGDKQYATTSAYGGLSYKTVVPASTNGTTAPSAPATSTDSSLPSGYTSM